MTLYIAVPIAVLALFIGHWLISRRNGDWHPRGYITMVRWNGRVWETRLMSEEEYKQHSA
jgi:hypothetical protein